MTSMSDQVSYRVADATALDFADASFAHAVPMNSRAYSRRPLAVMVGVRTAMVEVMA
jgi:hypothetical protein